MSLEDVKLNMTNWVVAARGWMERGAEQEGQSAMGAPIPPSIAPGGVDPQMMQQGAGPFAAPTPGATPALVPMA
jgi:hypothetical protein